MPARPARSALPAILLAAVALTAAACGGTDDTAAPPATTAAVTAVATTPDITVTQRATQPAADGAACSPAEDGNGLDHTVADLPADDPDGGLVVHADAGASAPRTGLLAPGTAVSTVNDPARCLVLPDGAVWWEVEYDGGSRGWVNSRFLTRTPGQEAATRTELCRVYREVLTYRSSPDFAPQELTAELEALLNGPPPGVGDALRRIPSPADEADLADAYTSLTGYVGPLCA